MKFDKTNQQRVIFFVLGTFLGGWVLGALTGLLGGLKGRR